MLIASTPPPRLETITESDVSSYAFHSYSKTIRVYIAWSRNASTNTARGNRKSWKEVRQQRQKVTMTGATWAFYYCWTSLFIVPRIHSSLDHFFHSLTLCLASSLYLAIYRRTYLPNQTVRGRTPTPRYSDNYKFFIFSDEEPQKSFFPALRSVAWKVLEICAIFFTLIELNVAFDEAAFSETFVACAFQRHFPR